ncbi:flagellar export chaperone FliS [uncultured Tolumonas sp.]|uniref:flagellar export chaperone FliS n=1 Tax=uncultured Tolumonas sp. TaxID=263765 RepID=UPI0029310CE5|nr:flagellar export chaperone FliS [uncultured Tolumonas sp.]
MYKKNINAYKSNSLEADISVADPHRVIQLMLQGLLERLAQTKGAIDRKDYQMKSVLVSKAMALINGLQDSLDLSYGKIPEDLFALYDYMKNRLLDSSKAMDSTPIDEIMGLVITIKSAWDQIPDSEKQQAYIMRQQKKEE